MTTVAISNLPAASAAASSDIIPIVQGGTTKRLTNTQLFTSPTIATPTMTGPILGTVTSGNISACTSTSMILTTPVLSGPALGTVASGNISNCLSTGMVLTTPTMTGPVLGAATGTSLAVTGAVTSSGTAGVGYATGAGGAVTQTVGRTNPTPSINKPTGSITLFSAAGTTAYTSFTVNNNTVAATDSIILSQQSGTDRYELNVTKITAAASFEITFRTTGGTTTETPIFNFAVIKGVAT